MSPHVPARGRACGPLSSQCGPPVVTCGRTVEQAREMLIAAAREMIAANRQLKAGLRYSRVASVLAYGGVVLIAVLLIIRGDR